MQTVVRLAIVVAALIVPPAFAEAASFDCAKAGTKTEKMICADPELSSLDGNLGKAYVALVGNAKLYGTAVVDLVRDNQRAWLKTRNACPDVACLKTAYTTRIDQLTGKSGPTTDPQAGDYVSDTVSIAVRALGDGVLVVFIEGGGATWTCAYGGAARQVGPNTLIVGKDKLKLTIDGSTATIADTAPNDQVSQSACGAAGSMIGSYRKE